LGLDLDWAVLKYPAMTTSLIFPSTLNFYYVETPTLSPHAGSATRKGRGR
jgi:hypothetical protein